MRRGVGGDAALIRELSSKFIAAFDAVFFLSRGHQPTTPAVAINRSSINGGAAASRKPDQLNRRCESPLLRSVHPPFGRVERESVRRPSSQSRSSGVAVWTPAAQ